MRIENNSLLNSTNKNISFVNGCVYAKEGPNCAGKINLGTVSINYDSFFSANMTLQPEDKDMPIMYGYLGTEVTFLAIVPHYNINPQVCPDDTRIEYYYEDQPMIKRTFTDILILTGNEEHRIPQIYLYNPTEQVVNLEIMVANMDINQISTQLNPEYEGIDGLSFNSIITDQIYGTNCTGSTQFEILDPLTMSATGTTGVTQMVIPYSKIDILEFYDHEIIIKTTSDTPIKLKFVSKFNTEQAFSKMNWVIEDSIKRYITISQPGLDVYGPVITFINNPIISTLPLNKAELNRRYIDSVIDYDDAAHTNMRDGIINNDNVEIIISNNSGEQLDEIIVDGNYILTFRIADLAGNMTSENKTLIVDSTGPEIHFKVNLDNEMDLSASTQTPGIIEDNDIIREYIDHVWDDVDGLIANSAITILVTSGGTPLNPITQIGDYEISFIVSDTYGNMTTENKNLKVVDSSYPIIHFNPVFSGTNLSAFTMSLSSDTANPVSGITNDDIRNYAITGVTDDYDGIINISNVQISGTVIPILNIGIYDIIFEVSDASGNTTYENKNLTIIT